MKKVILPSLMETYELVKLWDINYQTSTMDEEQDHAWINRRRSSRQKQKTRADSSPSLNDQSPEKVKSRQVSKPTPHDTNSKRPNSYPNVNVLQKLKRNLSNFREHTHFSELSSVQRTTASSQASTFSKVSMEADGATDVSIDSVTCRNRLDAHAWSSSKEYHESKVIRNEKCHSVDYATQIETHMNKRRSHETAKAKSLTSSSTDGVPKNPKNNINSSSIQQSLDVESKPQVRSLRRTHSSRTTHIGRKISESLKLKPSKRDLNSEREPPESLPVRSISQPHGLKTFGINKSDSEGDSNSIASNDEASFYYPMFAEVIHNFTAVGPHELGLERGTLIEILSKEVGPWWFGRIKKYKGNLVQEVLDPELGWFPKDFVRVINFPETDAFFLTQLIPMPHKVTNLALAKQYSSTEKESFKLSHVTSIVIDSPQLSPNILLEHSTTIVDDSSSRRLLAVKELLLTEVNYVKLLTSICEGYLPAMTKRIDIFPPNSIRLIFSNITAVYSFQRNFLLELRKGIEQDQIAKIFLKMHKGFLCYSTYCNSYPSALMELESYERVKGARIILENCRESQNFSEFPLSAHLLSPIQRICRYPLHLSEIMKMASKKSDDLLSDQDINDKLTQLKWVEANEVHLPDTRKTLEMALEAMKSITEAVNEGKRHSETILRYQSSFQSFEGPPLHFHSVRFFLQIDATRQQQNFWNSSYTLFLFDNQLIYCKRDIIKRSHFIYKGRIFIDQCRVVNVRDGKMFGQTIKNALRIYCETRDKWYDFCFRSANRKQKFLHTLALERQFGGKVLYVLEMTGFDSAKKKHDIMSQTEIFQPSEHELSETKRGSSGKNFESDVCASDINGEGFNKCLTKSPSKMSFIEGNVTLPKKSKSRDSIGFRDEIQSCSLGHRRLGNWFRRPKSSNSTPNLSPTHKPLIPMPLVTQSKELQLRVINRLGKANRSSISQKSESFF